MRYDRPHRGIAGAGGGGAGVVVETVDVTSGDVSIASGSWQAIGPDVAIDAAAGDYIEVSPSFLTNGGSDTECDWCTVIGGSPRRYYSSKTTTQRTNGFGGWYSTGVFTQWAMPTTMAVEAGDIASGQVTIRLLGKASGASRTWLADNADYIGSITVKNLGH